MVIPVFYVMARRRKGAVGRRSAKTSKASLKNNKKNSEQPVEKPNGSVFLSPAEVKAVKEIKTSMCTGDTHSASEQPNPLVVQSAPIAHKKFGKFRCLLEVRETEAAVCNTFVAPNVVKDSEEDYDAGEQESEEVQEIVIGQNDVDISESEQVVWEEEVVEELVVCEGVEIEEDEDEERIPPETLVLEEMDSKDADCDQVIEIADVDYCNQIESIVTCRDSEYSNNCRKHIDSDNIPQINRIAYTCNINSVQYPTLQSSIERESIKSEAVERRLGINCLDGYDLNDYEAKVPNSVITDQVTYDIQNNVVSMMKGVTLDQETFVVEVPDSDERLICESEQEKYGMPNREYDYNREQLVTKAALKQCPPVTYFSDNYVGRSLDCIDSNIHSRNFLPSLINSNKLGIKNHAENSSFTDIQGKLLFHNANSKDIDEDCQTSQFSDFKIGEDELDRKQQPVFRSRSGSTDTTGSESSSSCSTGVRRSNRIRSIGVTRQRVRGKNDNLDSNFCASISADKERTEIKVPESESPQVVSLYTEIRSGKNELLTPLNSIVNLPVITTSSVQSYDSDCNKPVKVKSRWRRSSELEMGGNRSSDSELATPPTPSISPRPIGNCLTGSSPRLVSPRAPPSLLTGSNVCEDNLDVAQKKEIRNEKKERDDKEMEERLRSFSIISENEYHTDRSTSKEAKRMVCDCFLTKEELSRGDMGCGEDCLNRLLMIECGSRCAVGDRCSNKHFQKHEYAKCDVFKTEKKGFGLRTLDDLPAGAFIMEYVGEVLDPKEFRRRAKEYAKEKNQHYYFMALKSDAIIDATVKGNTSRFINHSCEPNAETQKWTINGELRIGFFSKRQILAGEEITFDYQFQRYGKEAQRCYCETPSCRGWIGEDPEKEKRERKERKERELKKKREERRKDVKEYLDDMDLEEEIEKLGSSGLKNRAHTLTMCRLMVRAEDSESRIQLLKLIREGVPACRRLFLDYHGLRLIWSWMMNSSTNCENPDLDLRIEILETLAKLPIPNKTMIQDSKVMSLVEKWLQELESTSFLNENEISGANVICHKILKKERISVEEESVSDQEIKARDDSCRNQKSRMSAVLPGIDDDDEETTQDIENEKQIVDVASEIPLADLLERRGSESDDEGYGEATDKSSQPDDCDMKEETADKKHVFLKIAIKLLNEWNQLKEVFRIPKKERIEQMKEHEREADRGYKEYLDKEGHHDKQSYDRHWRQERFRSDYDKRKRLRDSPDVDRMRKTSRVEDSSRVLIPIPKMSKQERRHLFALKVAQKDEEERQRRQQQELWRQHEDQCMALGVDPNLTAFNNAQTGYPFYFNPASGTWQPYPTPDQNSVTSEPVSYSTQTPSNESPLLPSPQLGHSVPSAIGLPPQVSHPPGRPPPLLPSPHLPPPTHGPPPGCQPQSFPSHLPPPHLPPSNGQPLIHQVPPPALGPPPAHGPPSLPPPPHNSHLPPQGPPPCHGPPLHGLPPHRQPPPQGPPAIHGPPTHVPPPHHIPPPQGPPPSLLGPHPHSMPPPPHGPPPSQSHRPPLLPLPHYPPLPPGVTQPNQREIHMTSHAIGQAPMAPGSYEPPMSYDNVSHPAQAVMESGMTEIPLPAGPHPIVGTTVYQHPPPHLVYSSPQPINQTQPVAQPQYNVHPTMVPIQQPFNPNAPPLPPQPVKLPPKWKSAKDSEGRTYYYHVKTRISQWEPPPWNQGDPQPESDSSTESSEDDEDEDEEETSTTDDEEEEDEDDAEQEEKTEEYEEEEDGTEEKDDAENVKDTPSVSRARMTSPDRLAAPPTQENHQVKHVAEESRRKERRREGLVQERIISPRREEDRQDVSYREIKEKLRRKKELALGRARSDRSKKYHRDGKSRSSSKSEKPVTVAADTSSDTARKIKDQFRLQMAGVIVQYLNPYRKPDCQKGRITNTEDFKHLARKLTHFVMLKELKHCRSVEDLECNDNVKHKARDFIKKYMTKFGTVYQRPKDDD